MFLGPGAQGYRNEAGVVLGWDSPGDDDPGDKDSSADDCAASGRIEEKLSTFHAVWLANVTGVSGACRPAFSRISEETAYRLDDVFVVGWREWVEAESITAVPDFMWVRHNADNRPSGRTCRSMCMGDVVVVGEVAYACEALGFRRLDGAPRHIEAGTYVEYVQANR